jgi:PAS domain S-box-containing protein
MSPADNQDMKAVKAMLARTADGAVLVDEAGHVVFWNKAAQRLLGFQAAEVLGRPCHDVMRGETFTGHPFCTASCSIAYRLGCGGGVRNFDLQTRTKRGKVIWLNVSSLPVPSRTQGRFSFAHLFRDVTKRMRMLGLAGKLHELLAMPGGQPVSDTTRLRAAECQAGETPEIPRALPLTEREREILRWLAAGRSGKEIADRLRISPATVRNHIQHILEKLGAHTRLQALAIVFAPGGLSSRR